MKKLILSIAILILLSGCKAAEPKDRLMANVIAVSHDEEVRIAALCCTASESGEGQEQLLAEARGDSFSEALENLVSLRPNMSFDHLYALVVSSNSLEVLPAAAEQLSSVGAPERALVLAFPGDVSELVYAEYLPGGIVDELEELNELSAPFPSVFEVRRAKMEREPVLLPSAETYVIGTPGESESVVGLRLSDDILELAPFS